MDATTQDAGVRAEFVDDAGRFFRTALIGNFLQIPTFGFYRFWLTTDIRRHLWSHTRLDGEAFEYTGRARELLIGFLIALAILVPLYIAYFILAIEAERWQAFASVPLGLVIYVLAHYGSYRARRYRATRTIFRGIRLWMTGSGWSYAWRAILWDLLTALSLGLALPWRAASLERFKMRHTHFGDLPGSFAGTGSGFFQRGWWLWFMTIISPISIPVFVFFFYGVQSLGVPDAMKAAGFIIPALILVAVAVAYPVYRAIEMRWWLEGIRFGKLSMTSSLRKRSVLWCYVKAMLIGSVVFGVFGIILQAGAESSGFSFEDFNPAESLPVTAMVALVAFYVVSLFAMAVVMLQFITRGIWQVSTESVVVFNLATLDDVAARGAAAGSLGEGLADALDFGAGIGV